MNNQHTDSAAVIQAEQALAAAHLTLDIATIDRLLHPTYVLVQPCGTRRRIRRKRWFLS